jgi:Ca2+-transporting ATPase
MPSDRVAPPPTTRIDASAGPADSCGLSSAVAAERLRRDGPNVLPQPERRRPWTIVGNVLREPMVLLLLGATSIYVLLGDPRDAGLLGMFVLLVVAMTVYQEQKAERALQALRDLSSPRARVMRDGGLRFVAGPEVVVGDVIMVAEGDRVPADARVIEETDLHVDESMLTGESVPVHRGVSSEAGESGLLHASTLVVRGRGTAEVVATGTQTAVGRIGAALRAIQPEPTPMQREMRHVATLFAALSLAACVLMTGLYIALRGNWLDALLAGITLAMATIPEEFPVVLIVFLALGAWRMAQHKALVRRTPTIEALGAITVLCTDKTGTLTENRMAVAELAVDHERGGVDSLRIPVLRRLLETAALASPPRSYDPMDVALQDALLRAVGSSTAGDERPHVREYPLSPQCPAVAHVWLQPDTSLFVACKGAPEAVADLCRLPIAQRTAVLAEVDAMARRGLRVLAAASASWPGDGLTMEPPLPSAMHGFRFDWCGLVGFADPLRAGVAEAVAEAQAAGIRVIMLTGDHVETARAMADQAGVARQAVVALGGDIDALDDDGLAQRIADVNVFARVRPEHKLRLVNALKRSGQVVAMTGDGVNDAPALMAAHVGIAMGERGTDVAREASSIVLLDDNFVTVVHAIRLGRTIYDNIRRAVRYILAVHVPITGLALLPMVTGGPLVLLPLHVVFLQLIIDPACSIVFEREPAAPGIMQRPPRPPTQRLLGMRSLLGSLAHGAVMFAIVVAVYAMGSALALPPSQLGALAFTALVAGNVGLIMLYRTGTSVWNALRQPNATFWVVVPVTLAVLAVVTRFELPAGWFGFTPPPAGPWLIALLLPLLVVVLLNVLPSRNR